MKPAILLSLAVSSSLGLVGSPGTASSADPTFVLEIPADTRTCGVFQDGRTPAEELALKCRVTFRQGQWDLPGGAVTVPAEIIESLEFGPDALPGAPVTAGLFRVTKDPSPWEPGVVYYGYSFEQDWQAGGVPIHFRDYGGINFRVVDGVPDASVRRLDEESISRSESIFFGHVGDGPPDQATTIRFSSCSYANLPLWDVSVSMEGGYRALLHERYQIPMAGSGPAQIVRGELWLGDEHIIETSYWQLVYAADHHNWNEQYWVIFDAPITVGEISGVRGFFVQEGFFEIPRRAALLGTDLKEVKPLEILKYDQVLSGETPPPAFVRGEANGDGDTDVSDVVTILLHLFGGQTADCLEAADFNDDGQVSVTDPILLLLFMFLDGDPPAAPYPECGDDPTPDEVSDCTVGC